MKRILLLAVALLSVMYAFAQEYPMMPQPGVKMVYSVTAKTPMGTTNMSVTQQIQSADENSVVLAMSTSLLGNVVGQTTTIKYDIDGSEYVISLKEAMAENLAQLGGNFQIMEGSEDLRYPIALTEDIRLQPAKMSIKASVQGMELEMGLAVKDRKAIGVEVVTTPAGTFECIKFTENQVLSLMGQEQVTQVTYWYGKEVGLVKQTSYSMGGLVAAELQLEKIEQPL